MPVAAPTVIEAIPIQSHGRWWRSSPAMGRGDAWLVLPEEPEPAKRRPSAAAQSTPARPIPGRRSRRQRATKRWARAGERAREPLLVEADRNSVASVGSRGTRLDEHDRHVGPVEARQVGALDHAEVAFRLR